MYAFDMNRCSSLSSSLTNISIPLPFYQTLFDYAESFLSISNKSNEQTSIISDATTTITNRSDFNWDHSIKSSNEHRYLPATIDVQVLRSRPPIIVQEIIYQPKQLIIEYDQINVKLQKNIQQKKLIKRVNPFEYVRQYGSSLYSQDVFQNIFTKVIS